MEHGQDVKSLAWHPHEEVSTLPETSWPRINLIDCLSRPDLPLLLCLTGFWRLTQPISMPVNCSPPISLPNVHTIRSENELIPDPCIRLL